MTTQDETTHRFAVVTSFISRSGLRGAGDSDTSTRAEYQDEAAELVRLLELEDDPDGLLHRFAKFALRSLMYVAEDATVSTNHAAALRQSFGRQAVIGHHGSVAALIATAAATKQPAGEILTDGVWAPIITDHGNLHGASRPADDYAKQGYQPIAGIENYWPADRPPSIEDNVDD